MPRRPWPGRPDRPRSPARWSCRRQRTPPRSRPARPTGPRSSCTGPVPKRSSSFTSWPSDTVFTSSTRSTMRTWLPVTAPVRSRSRNRSRPWRRSSCPSGAAGSQPESRSAPLKRCPKWTSGASSPSVPRRCSKASSAVGRCTSTRSTRSQTVSPPPWRGS